MQHVGHGKCMSFPTAFLHQAPYPVEVGSPSPWHDTLHAKHTSHVSQGGGNDLGQLLPRISRGVQLQSPHDLARNQLLGLTLPWQLPNILGISGRCLTGVWLGLLMVSNIQLNYNLAFEPLFGSNFVAFRFVPKTSSRACSCGCRILPSFRNMPRLMSQPATQVVMVRHPRRSGALGLAAGLVFLSFCQ